MPTLSAHRVDHVLIACLLPLLAALLQWLLWEHLPPFAWLFLYPAVFFSARIGGLSGGICATLIAIPLGIYFFIPPLLDWHIAGPEYLYAIIIFAGMGFSFSLFHSRMATLQTQLQLHTKHSLENVQSQLNLVLNSTQTGLWQWKSHAAGFYASTAARQLHNIADTTENISFRQWLSYIYPDDRCAVKTILQSELKAGHRFTLEYRVANQLAPDYRWLLVVAEPKRDAAGAPQYYEGIVADITKHKQAILEKEAKDAEFRQLAEAMPQIVWVCEADGNNIYFNQKWVDYTGLSLADSYGTGWKTPFHPDDQQRAWQAWQNAIHEQATYALECRLRRHDGEYRWWLIRGVPYQNALGQIKKWFGTCTDIHDIKIKEAALRDSEYRWQFALEGSNQGVWDWDIPSGKVYFSTRWKSMLGFSEEMIGDHVDEWAKRVHPDDMPDVMRDVERHLNGETTSYQNEHRVQNQQGDYLWILDKGLVVSRAADGKAIRMIGTHTDITQQRNTMDALLNKERLLAESQHIAHIGSWMLELTSSQISWSDETFHLFGLSPSAQPPTLPELSTYIHADDRLPMEEWLAQCCSGFNPGELEYRIHRHDGKLIWLLMCCAMERDHQGKGTRLIGTIQDITSRKQAETQLRLLAAALEASANAIMITNPLGVIEWVNQGFTQMTGYAMEDVAGKTLQDLLNSSVSPESYADMWKTVLSGKVWSGELLNQHSNGTSFPVEQVLTPILGEPGQVAHVIAVKKDITQRKQAELALQNSLISYQQLSHHLETIREDERIRIAREIHDELGGFLTALKIDLSLLLKKMPAELVDCQTIAGSMKKDIHHGLKAIKRIINDLRPSVLDHLGLMAAIEWLGNTLLKPSGISFIVSNNVELTHLSPELATAIFRITQETLVNIVKHAHARQVVISIELSAQVLSLHIIDDGNGINPDNDKSINGFGIQGMRERARYFGGDLLIESPLQGGTMVRLHIPFVCQGDPNGGFPLNTGQHDRWLSGAEANGCLKRPGLSG